MFSIQERIKVERTKHVIGILNEIEAEMLRTLSFTASIDFNTREMPYKDIIEDVMDHLYHFSNQEQVVIAKYENKKLTVTVQDRNLYDYERCLTRLRCYEKKEKCRKEMMEKKKARRLLQQRKYQKIQEKIYESCAEPLPKEEQETTIPL